MIDDPTPTSATMPFHNQPIDPADLPVVDAVTFNPLARGYLFWHWTAGALFAALALIVLWVVMAVTTVAPTVLASALVVIVVGVLAWVVAVTITFNHRGWMVRDHDLSTRQGVLTRTTMTVPFSRVQNVEVTQTPLERVYSVATLRVSTAGIDLRLSGIDPQQAEQLRVLVFDRIEHLTPEASKP